MLATATPPLDTEGEQQKQLQHQQQGPRSADGEQSATKHNDDHHTESTDHSDASALPLLHGGSSTPSSRTGGTLSPDSSVDDSFALRASSPTDLATSFDAHFHYGYAQDASSSTSLLEHQHYRQQPQHPQVAGKSLPTSVALPQATLHQYQTLLADDTIMSESDDHEMSAMAAAAMNATSVVTAHDESAQAASNSEASDTTKPSVPSAAADLRLRVKLYELTGDSKWEDRGTGICCVVYVESKDAVCMVVRAESDQHIVLECPVLKQDVYQRQQDTLIVWTELDGSDLALSFQDEKGCHDIWETICDVQQRLRGLADDHGGEMSDVFHEFDRENNIMPSELDVTMPAIELTTLAQVEERITDISKSNVGRDRLVHMVSDMKLVDKMCELFEMAEDMDMKAELVHIFNITKTLVLLSDYAVSERFLEDDIIYRLCGIFEYDPEYVVPHHKYRDFIGDKTRFKRVIKFKDPDMEQKIHQTFRAQYLKDVVLARIVEEAHFSVLSSIVMFNQVDILNALSKDQDFLQEIFNELRAPETPYDRRKTLLLFIQDFCAIAKNLQTVNRQAFYRALAGNGIIQELPPFFDGPDFMLRMVVVDILQSILDHDATLLRSFVLAQKKHGTRTLTDLMVERLIVDPDDGMKFHCAEILRLFMDSSAADGDKDTADFLAHFFNEEFLKLMGPFKDLAITTTTQVDGTTMSRLALDPVQALAFVHVLELSSFLVRTHHHRLKFMLLSGDLLLRIGLLLHSNDTSVKLAAIRFYRALVGLQDEFFNRFLIKNNILQSTMDVFAANGSRYNMLNSTVLEMLEFVRTKECKSLIDYLVERFRPILEAIDYVPTGTKLVLRYEQLHDKSGAGSVDDKLGSDDTTNTARRGWSGMDKDEEAYFKDDGDDEEPEIGPHPEKATPTTEAVDSESETNIDDDDDLAHLPSIRRSSADDDDDEDGMFTRRLPSKGRVDSAPPTGGGLLKGRPRAGGLIAGGSKKSYGLVDYEDDEEESAVTSVSGTSSKKSSPPSVSDLPPAAAVTPTKRSASTLSPSTDPRTLSPDIPVEEATPTKVRSLTLGAKRMAIAPGDVGGSEATHESATTATTTSEAIKGDSTD